MDIDKLRRTIREAALMHNASYDEDTNKHGVSIEEACAKACVKNGVDHLVAPLLWLALQAAWNDALGWADGDYDGMFDDDGGLHPWPVEKKS